MLGGDDVLPRPTPDAALEEGIMDPFGLKQHEQRHEELERRTRRRAER